MTGTVLIAFGANLGDPIRTLQVAYQELAQLWTPVAASSVYRSTPVGGVEQADFLNALAAFATENSGSEILNTLHQIENVHARTREVRWGPRTLAAAGGGSAAAAMARRLPGSKTAVLGG